MDPFECRITRVFQSETSFHSVSRPATRSHSSTNSSQHPSAFVCGSFVVRTTITSKLACCRNHHHRLARNNSVGAWFSLLLRLDPKQDDEDDDDDTKSRFLTLRHLYPYSPLQYSPVYTDTVQLCYHVYRKLWKACQGHNIPRTPTSRSRVEGGWRHRGPSTQPLFGFFSGRGRVGRAGMRMHTSLCSAMESMNDLMHSSTMGVVSEWSFLIMCTVHRFMVIVWFCCMCTVCRDCLD